MKKPQDGAFAEAVKSLVWTKKIMKAAGIEAKYTITVTDLGPGVEVCVPEKSYGLAQDVLPFSIGSATVKITKK